MDTSPTPPQTTHHSPLTTTQSPRWKWFIRLLSGLAILLLLLFYRNGAHARQVLQNVPWYVVLGAVLFYWVGQLLSAFKWQLLLKAQGAQIHYQECCRLYLVGMFWNLWMPTNIGGDAVRAYHAGAQCGSKAVAASSILVERLTGFLALLAIGFIALLLNTTQQNQSSQGWHVIVMVSALMMLFLGVVAALRSLAYRLAKQTPGSKIINKWAGLHRALDLYIDRQHRGTLILSLILSFIFQASQVLLNIGLAYYVGLNLPPMTFWWLVPVLSAASLLPVGIGGLGVREAAAVGLLQGTHAPTGTIVAWSLLWQATVWLASLPGGFWSLGQIPRDIPAEST